jgi:hypothetical protein
MTMPEAKQRRTKYRIMNRDEMFRKNNELFAMFMQHILDNPDLMDQIPDGADIIFLPDSDPLLRQANLELGQEREREGAQVTFIRIEMVPEIRTVYVPRLRLEAPSLANLKQGAA